MQLSPIKMEIIVACLAYNIVNIWFTLMLIQSNVESSCTLGKDVLCTMNRPVEIQRKAIFREGGVNLATIPQ